MKVILVSMPKAGTYLATGVLQKLGWNFSGYHLQTTHYTDYTEGETEVARFEPEKLKVEMPLEESLRLIGRKQFAVGHLPMNPAVTRLLRGFEIIFLQREVRSAICSYFRFLRETGRQNSREKDWFSEPDLKLAFHSFLEDQGARRIEMYAAFHRWRGLKQVRLLCFEWFKQGEYEKISSALRGLVGFGGRRKIERAVLETSAAASLTRSKKAETGPKFGVDSFWSEHAEDFFIRHGGLEANRLLGY